MVKLYTKRVAPCKEGFSVSDIISTVNQCRDAVADGLRHRAYAVEPVD